MQQRSCRRPGKRQRKMDCGQPCVNCSGEVRGGERRMQPEDVLLRDFILAKTDTAASRGATCFWREAFVDRKSTRLNSSHRCISYAVFCLKKKTSVRRYQPL